MTGNDGDSRPTVWRVAAIVVRVLAVLGGVGVCGWIALWLAFAF